VINREQNHEVHNLKYDVGEKDWKRTMKFAVKQHYGQKQFQSRVDHPKRLLEVDAHGIKSLPPPAVPLHLLLLPHLNSFG
jgi:hypothetical protein